MFDFNAKQEQQTLQLMKTIQQHILDTKSTNHPEESNGDKSDKENYYKKSTNPYRAQDFTGVDSRFANIVDAINSFVEPGKKILDVGCGDFILKNLLFNHESVGIDITDIKVDQYNKPIVVHNISNTPYPFPEEEFGAVILSEVLEHVWSPEVILAECQRLLAPKGKLLITVPNFDNIDYRLNRYRPVLYHPDNIFSVEHIRHYNLESLNVVLSRKGYSICFVTGNSPNMNKFFVNARQQLGNFIFSNYDKEIDSKRVDQLIGQMFPTDCMGILVLAEKQ